MKARRLIFAAISLAGIASAGADETDAMPDRWSQAAGAARLTGQLRADYFRSSKTLDDDVDFLGVTAQLKALPLFSPQLDAKVEARFTHPALGEAAPTRGTLLESYLAIHFPGADLRLGRQIVAWGRADGINPTDNLTPRDYAVLLPFEDDQRFGTSGARLDVVLPADFTLSTFLTPWFEPATIPFPREAMVAQTKPSRSLANTEVGVRLNRTGAGVDWSLSYFHGFSPLPSLRLADGAPQPIELRYDPINVFGADFARNFGRLGFRGEIAYMDTRDRSGSDPEKRNPNLFLIVGVDRTFFDQLNVNLQYFRREVRHYDDPALIADASRREVAVLHSILNGERHRASDGLSFRVSNKWLNDTLEAEIFGVANLTTRDRFVRASATYAITDHWKATVGGDFFSGRNDTQFGLQKRNRGTFSELKFAF